MSLCAAGSLYLYQEDCPLAIIEKKPEKNKVDEEMVDRIVAEAQRQKPLKERIYDKVTIPVWALDVLIGALALALVAVIIFGRG